MERGSLFVLLGLLSSLTLVRSVTQADMPYPAAPDGTDVHRYEEYCHLKQGELPTNYKGGDVWKYSSAKSGDPLIDASPTELYGVTGMSVDKAWEIIDREAQKLPS
jgi:hypothetical protein